jgi:hypothetical protein
MPAAEPELKTDPIAGEWRWNGNKDVYIDPDGTATQTGGKGKWKLLESTTTVERKYEFVWKKDDGKIYIDTMILSGDKNRLEGRNQSNRRVSAKRMP